MLGDMIPEFMFKAFEGIEVWRGDVVVDLFVDSFEAFFAVFGEGVRALGGF